MKVIELIQDLQDFDPETEIRIMWQPSWPFESSIQGVTRRECFSDEEIGDPEPRVDYQKTDIANDVIIVMGSPQ